MAERVDLNADMGESYGRWTLGDDASLMPHLTSANIACGFHGGDPHVMRRTIALAAEHGVGIGAHVALPDLLGFGRRRLAISAGELKDYVTYQSGALRAFADAEGARLALAGPDPLYAGGQAVLFDRFAKGIRFGFQPFEPEVPEHPGIGLLQPSNFHTGKFFRKPARGLPAWRADRT